MTSSLCIAEGGFAKQCLTRRLHSENPQSCGNRPCGPRQYPTPRPDETLRFSTTPVERKPMAAFSRRNRRAPFRTPSSSSLCIPSTTEISATSGLAGSCMKAQSGLAVCSAESALRDARFDCHQPHKTDRGAAAKLFPKGTRSILS